MAQDINSVCLVGRLTKDPELRSTSGGTEVCVMRVAVGDRRKDSRTGDWVDHAGFFDVTCFGKTAEAVEKYLQRGSQLGIMGRLDFQEWEDRDTGQKRSKVGVIADRVQFLGGSGDDDGRGERSNSRDRKERDDDRPREREPARQSRRHADDDDIPF